MENCAYLEKCRFHTVGHNETFLLPNDVFFSSRGRLSNQFGFWFLLMSFIFNYLFQK